MVPELFNFGATSNCGPRPFAVAPPSSYNGAVEKTQAMQVMSALAQPTRLDVWRLLVERLPEGMSAGDIAKAVGMTKNGMSPNFVILAAAGLVSSEKLGRSIIYRASTDAVEELAAYLKAACTKG